MSDPAPPGGPDRSALLELREVMTRLRAECGWKAVQTHRTLARHLLEETHETLDVISVDGPPDDAELTEELGDLLLQVYFHAAIAEEGDRFTIEDVAAGIVAKMRRRNPHVFGTAELGADDRPTDPAAINELWESVKAAEKQRDSLLDGIGSTLPALLLADKVLDRLERAGEPTPAVLARATDGDDPGSRVATDLLAVVARARAAGVDPEQELRVLARRLASGPAAPQDR